MEQKYTPFKVLLENPTLDPMSGDFLDRIVDKYINFPEITDEMIAGEPSKVASEWQEKLELLEHIVSEEDEKIWFSRL
jgi:hypothetical protein